MKKKHIFLMPDYYQRFACKMGACRGSCCVGWPISFSLEDYFHLTTLDCSPELHDRIDRGIRLLLSPTPGRYAQIAPRYDGNCSLRLEDGRCALHAELGENALTDICRLYPRGVRFAEGYEISCANSCEAVIELLLQQDAPIQFIRQELEMQLPPNAERHFTFPTLNHGQELRLWFIHQMQERSHALPQRLLALENNIRHAETALQNKDEATLLSLLQNTAAIPAQTLEATQQHLSAGLEKAELLLKIIDASSTSVHEYGEEALAFFKDGKTAYERYLMAKKRFETSLPKWSIYFEHLLVNHMFFSEFPFQDRPESFHDEYMALCVIYTLLRFLCIGWLAQHDQAHGFIDICAAAFRMIDHTDFDRYAVQLLKQMNIYDSQHIHDWIIL